MQNDTTLKQVLEILLAWVIQKDCSVSSTSIIFRVVSNTDLRADSSGKTMLTTSGHSPDLAKQQSLKLLDEWVVAIQGLAASLSMAPKSTFLVTLIGTLHWGTRVRRVESLWKDWHVQWDGEHGCPLLKIPSHITWYFASCPVMYDCLKFVCTCGQLEL